MSSDIAAHAVGVLLLGVHNLYDEKGDDKVSLFCCTHFEYSLGINELPSINATIGIGAPISGSAATKNNTSGSLKDLRDAGLRRRTDASKFLRCSFYEADNDGTMKKAIFRGYIISLSEIVKTASGHLKAMRIMCMGIGALLHISPIAGFRRTNSAVLINSAIGSLEMPTAGSLNTSVFEPYTALQSVTEDEISGNYADDLLSHDVLTKAALLANIIAIMGEITPEESDDIIENPDDSLLGIKKCIFCDYYLDKAEMNADAEKGFDKYLCRQLLATLQQSSVLNALVTTLTGMDVMMSLVPHFVLGGKADDFRMELRPIDAWNAVDIIKIPNAYVIECNTNMNYMAHLNDPDVLIVDYSSGAGSADGSRTSGEDTGCFGVYSPIAAISQWARYRYTGSKEQDKAEQMILDMSPRVRIEPAPVWLDFSMLNQLQGSATVKLPKFTPKNDNEAKGGKRTKGEDDDIRAGLIADQIAKTMYLYLHGAADTAAFQLTTDVRFGLNKQIGCLENHVGKTVDIFGYRGILKQIRYVYASGQSTNNSYQITLDRVRRINEKEQKIKCPMYKRGKHDKRLTGNNELWADTADRRESYARQTAAQENEERLRSAYIASLLEKDEATVDQADRETPEQALTERIEANEQSAKMPKTSAETKTTASSTIAEAKAEAAAAGISIAQAINERVTSG